MPDVTGRVYEAFTEYILRRLGYRDEWMDGPGRQYLYERHVGASCHQSATICAHALACHEHASAHNLPYGPWYDPDFFILDGGWPAACLYVTHWSNPRDSKRKFWRTVEDHFQYKSGFGDGFIGVNLVFVALNEGTPPYLLRDASERLFLHGWDPAIASVLVGAFDATVLFPREYGLLELYAARLPDGGHGGARRRRNLYNQVWEGLYQEEPAAREAIDLAVLLVQEALGSSPHPRYSPSVLEQMRSNCHEGRQRAAGVHPTYTRYRKGLQHAFILREMVARRWPGTVDPDEAVWTILAATPRFPWAAMRSMLCLPIGHPEADVADFRDRLSAVPVQTDQGEQVTLLNSESGLEHAEWNPDLKQFILGLRSLSDADRVAFRESVTELYRSYHGKYGIPDVLADIADPERVAAKVAYVADRYLNVADREAFVTAVSADMLTPGSPAPHQAAVPDVHNWVLDILLTFYDLGSVQELNNRIFGLFEERTGESLRLYAYQGNYLVGYLLAGVDVAPHISRNARLGRDGLYDTIWPLITECLWEAILGRVPLSRERAAVDYTYKKAMRIISSPDLEPIDFLVKRHMAHLADGPVLRGAFNQLSVLRGWGRSALTTETSLQDTATGAVIQKQAVFGQKHIADKTRELAGRIRSVHLRCGADGLFQQEPEPGTHYLVVDGDWPVESKINLYEAGFTGIHEIGELESLSAELACRANEHDA